MGFAQLSCNLRGKVTALESTGSRSKSDKPIYAMQTKGYPMKFIIMLMACLTICACATNHDVRQPVEKPITEQTVTELESNIGTKHPSTYMILAEKLFAQGNKEEAVKWLYVGQIRYRAYLMANPDLDPSGDPALFSSLMSVVGAPLNEYIGGDVDAWVKTIDDAITWHNQNSCEYLDKESHKEIYASVLSGLSGLRNKIASSKDSIREQRTQNGLENRQ